MLKQVLAPLRGHGKRRRSSRVPDFTYELALLEQVKVVLYFPFGEPDVKSDILGSQLITCHNYLEYSFSILGNIVTADADLRRLGRMGVRGACSQAGDGLELVVVPSSAFQVERQAAASSDRS